MADQRKTEYNLDINVTPAIRVVSDGNCFTVLLRSKEKEDGAEASWRSDTFHRTLESALRAAVNVRTLRIKAKSAEELLLRLTEIQTDLRTMLAPFADMVGDALQEIRAEEGSITGLLDD